MLNKKQQNELKKYFITQPIEAVYLFGSQAKGKSTNLSDVDLAVLFKDGIGKSRRFNLRLEMICEAKRLLKNKRTDVIDLEEAPIPLQHAAVSMRKELVAYHSDKQILFEAKVNSRYFDQFYFIRQNTINSLASIARM